MSQSAVCCCWGCKRWCINVCTHVHTISLWMPILEKEQCSLCWRNNFVSTIFPMIKKGTITKSKWSICSTNKNNKNMPVMVYRTNLIPDSPITTTTTKCRRICKLSETHGSRADQRRCSHAHCSSDWHMNTIQWSIQEAMRNECM